MDFGIVLVLPIPLAIILYLLILAAPVLFPAAFAYALVHNALPFMPYVGFFAMCLLTVHMYIAYFKSIGVLK